MNNRTIHLLAAACLVALVSACGFHLRGAYPLPAAMDSTYVDYSGTDTAIRQATVRALDLNGVKVASSSAGASAILELQQAQVRRDILSRDRQGRPQEYAVEIHLKFRVIDADGETIVESSDVMAETVLALDTTDPTASRSELDAAVSSLREDAVWQMIRSLSSAAGNTATP